MLTALVLSVWFAVLLLISAMCPSAFRPSPQPDVDATSPAAARHPIDVAVIGKVLTLNAELAETLASEAGCCICLEPFEPGEVVKLLPCGHYNHRGCIDPWLKSACSCPQCRQQFSLPVTSRGRGDDDPTRARARPAAPLLPPPPLPPPRGSSLPGRAPSLLASPASGAVGRRSVPIANQIGWGALRSIADRAAGVPPLFNALWRAPRRPAVTTFPADAGPVSTFPLQRTAGGGWGGRESFDLDAVELAAAALEHAPPPPPPPPLPPPLPPRA